MLTTPAPKSRLPRFTERFRSGFEPNTQSYGRQRQWDERSPAERSLTFPPYTPSKSAKNNAPAVDEKNARYQSAFSRPSLARVDESYDGSRGYAETAYPDFNNEEGTLDVQDIREEKGPSIHHPQNINAMKPSLRELDLNSSTVDPHFAVHGMNPLERFVHDSGPPLTFYEPRLVRAPGQSRFSEDLPGTRPLSYPQAVSTRGKPFYGTELPSDHEHQRLCTARRPSLPLMQEKKDEAAAVSSVGMSQILQDGGDHENEDGGLNGGTGSRSKRAEFEPPPHRRDSAISTAPRTPTIGERIHWESTLPTLAKSVRKKRKSYSMDMRTANPEIDTAIPARLRATSNPSSPINNIARVPKNALISPIISTSSQSSPPERSSIITSVTRPPSRGTSLNPSPVSVNPPENGNHNTPIIQLNNPKRRQSGLLNLLLQKSPENNNNKSLEAKSSGKGLRSRASSFFEKATGGGGAKKYKPQGGESPLAHIVIPRTIPTTETEPHSPRSPRLRRSSISRVFGRKYSPVDPVTPSFQASRIRIEQ